MAPLPKPTKSGRASRRSTRSSPDHIPPSCETQEGGISLHPIGDCTAVGQSGKATYVHLQRTSICMENPTPQPWPARLAEAGRTQEDALAELRVVLMKGIRSGLSGRAGVDDAFIEDVTQGALVRIMDHLHTFKGKSRFTTWALSIGMRVAFIELRRKHWSNVSLDALRENSNGVEDADPGLRPDEQSEQRGLYDFVHRAIAEQLTPRQRELLLGYLNGMPQDELARQLGLSRNAVYKLGHDARKALKSALEAEGFGVEHLRELIAVSKAGSRI